MPLVEPEEIPGVMLARRVVHADDRGFFLEIFGQDALGVSFDQGNHSHSRAGVLRDLHSRTPGSSSRARPGSGWLTYLSGRTVPRWQGSTLLNDPAVLHIPPGVSPRLRCVNWSEPGALGTHFVASDEYGVPGNDPDLAATGNRGADPLGTRRERTASRLASGGGGARLTMARPVNDSQLAFPTQGRPVPK